MGLLCRLGRKIITSSRPDETTRRCLSQRSPRKRLSRTKKTRPHLRIRMIQSQILDATQEKPGTHLYDGVLVDAPCSGWGTWARSPDARWRTSTKEVRQSARRQQAILKNVAQAVKSGGTLVYAVCTLTQPETDEQVAAFLDIHPAFELDPFRHPITGELTGRDSTFASQHDGMFIARFRKKTACRLILQSFDPLNSRTQKMRPPKRN